MAARSAETVGGGTALKEDTTRTIPPSFKTKHTKNQTLTSHLMKNRFDMRPLLSLIAVLLTCLLPASCLKNDDEIDLTQYNDLFVSSVAFGSMPRYLHTTASDGSDSIFKTTVSAASLYPLSIDHLSNTIYNADSLPLGVDAAKIIFSTFNTSQGTLAIEKPGTEEDTLYTTSDSIDFSNGPRKFKLYGLDGTSRRTYTVDVRIHREATDSLTWRKLTREAWESEERQCGHRGTTFEACGLQFRLRSGGIDVCPAGEEDETAATPDGLEEANAGELPTDNAAWILLDGTADQLTKQALLYGTVQQADSLASRIWRRFIDTTGARSYVWEYLPATVENRFPARALRCPTLLKYDAGLLLVGIDRDGHISLKYSIDGGRIWKNHNYLQLPDELKTRTASSLQASIDAHQNLWLLIDEEETWYGRAHSVAWKTEDGIFIRGLQQR